MFDQAPTLSYIGWLCIALALSNPKTIQHIFYRVPLLKIKISRDLLNTQTLVYGFFVGFLASHLSSVLMDLPDIFASSAINYIRIFEWLLSTKYQICLNTLQRITQIMISSR
jgi:hypothetical protein